MNLRCLHLSDFHVGKDGYGQHHLFAQLLQNIRQHVESGFAPDLVFITGDIADKGQDTQYQEFRSAFAEPLVSLLGTDPGDRLFFVPNVGRPNAILAGPHCSPTAPPA